MSQRKRIAAAPSIQTYHKLEDVSIRPLTIDATHACVCGRPCVFEGDHKCCFGMSCVCAECLHSYLSNAPKCQFVVGASVCGAASYIRLADFVWKGNKDSNLKNPMCHAHVATADWNTLQRVCETLFACKDLCIRNLAPGKTVASQPRDTQCNVCRLEIFNWMFDLDAPAHFLQPGRGLPDGIRATLMIMIGQPLCMGCYAPSLMGQIAPQTDVWTMGRGKTMPSCRVQVYDERRLWYWAPPNSPCIWAKLPHWYRQQLSREYDPGRGLGRTVLQLEEHIAANKMKAAADSSKNAH